MSNTLLNLISALSTRKAALTIFSTVVLLPVLNLNAIEPSCPILSGASVFAQVQPACGGGGGGSYNYGLNWNGNLTQPVIVGGVSGRPGPGASVFTPLGYPKQFYVAYTSTQNPVGDQAGDQYVYVSTRGYSGLGSFALINAVTGVVSSDANPALLGYYLGPTNYLLLSVNSQYRQGVSGFSSMFVTSDGQAWNEANQFPIQPLVDYSPSMAVDSNWIYLGLRNSGDHTLVLCRETLSQTNASCKNFPGSRAMNFNPSLAVTPGGVLLIGYEEYDNTHALRIFTSTDQGQTINENTNITSVNEDTTSTAPSIASHNGAMYIGFRTNDSANKLLYRYSTDGYNWSARIDPNYTMAGAPMFVEAFGVPGFGNTLANFFSSNDSNNYLVQWLGASN